MLYRCSLAAKSLDSPFSACTDVLARHPAGTLTRAHLKQQEGYHLALATTNHPAYDCHIPLASPAPPRCPSPLRCSIASTICRVLAAPTQHPRCAAHLRTCSTPRQMYCVPATSPQTHYSIADAPHVQYSMLALLPVDAASVAILCTPTLFCPCHPAAHARRAPQLEMRTPSAIPSARGERSPPATSLRSPICTCDVQHHPQHQHTPPLFTITGTAFFASALATTIDAPRPSACHDHRLRHIPRASPIPGAPPPACPAAAATVLHRQSCLRRLPARHDFSQGRLTPCSKCRRAAHPTHPPLRHLTTHARWPLTISGAALLTLPLVSTIVTAFAPTRLTAAPTVHHHPYVQVGPCLFIIAYAGPIPSHPS
ncbi:hypothetical protein DFH07DRAFT_974057 [Mycena maculata]|uniref:Uncharacterized protein n=1 Tax=Mycena maculata TaxID=230809 RepID=A0AAD7HAX2_9AGAR|nr:hypothetical protein DFH07DRAFT_974057 [Mycena maculata]